MNGKELALLLRKYEHGNSLTTPELRELGEGLLKMIEFFEGAELAPLARLYYSVVHEIDSYLFARGECSGIRRV